VAEACKHLLGISLDCSDPFFHKYCDCHPWSNPLQLDWTSELTSSPADPLSPLQLNQTQHNTTQPFSDDEGKEEHVYQESTQGIASQPQEISSTDLSLSRYPNPVSTSAVSSRTSSPVQLQATGNKQLKDLSRIDNSAVQKRHCCRIDSCGKNFGRPQEVQRHEKEVHGLGSKVLRCPASGCTFNTESRKDNLRRHVKRCHPAHPALVNVVNGL